MTPARILVVCLVASLPAAADPPTKKSDPAVKRELDRLRGTWWLVEIKTNLAPDEVAERRGNEWVSGAGLEAARVRAVRGVTFVIDGNTIRVKRARSATPARVVAFPDCTFVVDPSTSPRGLDLTPTDPPVPEGERRVFGACYMLDGDDLWLCDHGGNADRPTGFSMGVGIAYPKRIFVLKREPAAK